MERMATRAPAHAKQQKAIFDAFLAGYPSFAKMVKEVDQPDTRFPMSKWSMPERARGR